MPCGIAVERSKRASNQQLVRAHVTSYATLTYAGATRPQLDTTFTSNGRVLRGRNSSGREELIEQRHISRALLGEREPTAYQLSAPIAHVAAPRRITEKIQESSSHCARIAGGNEMSVHPLRHYFPRSTDVCCHDRDTRRTCLEDDIRKPLG